LARNAENFLVTAKPFLSKLSQVILIETIGEWNMNLVPPIVARFVSPDQQNRISSRIKGIRRSKWAAMVLGAQLPFLGQLSPPITKLVCVLDFPLHEQNIAPREYSFDRILLMVTNNAR